MGYSRNCDFVLTIVKGLVEHDDGTVYFASLMGYGVYRDRAIEKGWVVLGPKTVRDGEDTYEVQTDRLTEAGRKAYAENHLDRLPKGVGDRAYAWDWDVIEDAPVGLQRAAAEAPRLREPTLSGRCWLLVKQPSTGSARSRYAPRYDNCRNRARKGFKTCGGTKNTRGVDNRILAARLVLVRR